MKNLIYTIIIAIFLLPIHKVYAQNNDATCPICQQPSKIFSRYTEFVYSTLANINSIGKLWDITGKAASPWLFQKWALTLKNTDPWEKTTVTTSNNISKKLQTSMVIGILFAQDTIEITSTDILMGLSSSFKNKWFQRDLETLYDLDELIDQKKLELAEAWSFFNKATTQDRQAIQTNLNTYMTDLLEPSRSYINDNLHYNEIISVLEQSQQKRKYLIIRGMINQFTERNKDNNLQSQFITTQQHNITIAYKVDSILQAQTEYKCGRWVSACDSDIKSFSKSIGQNIKQQGNSMKEALQRFWQSAQNLGFLFRKDSSTISEKNKEKYESFLQKKNELASSYHWLDGQYTKWWIREKIAITSNGRNLIQSIVKNYQNKETVAQKSKPKNTNEIPTTTTTENQKQLSIEFKTSIKESMNIILVSAALHSNRANTSDPKSITNMIPWLNQKIKEINDIIGDRERKNSIIKNLGIACEKQCNNAWGICRY